MDWILLLVIISLGLGGFILFLYRRVSLLELSLLERNLGAQAEPEEKDVTSDAELNVPKKAGVQKTILIGAIAATAAVIFWGDFTLRDAIMVLAGVIIGRKVWRR